MAAPLVLGCLWVLAATVTAMLPMRRQFAPGLALLLSAPVLVAWLTASVGWWVGAGALVAALSMFRRPLAAMARWALSRGKAA